MTSPPARPGGPVRLHDLHPPPDDLCADVARGLTGPVRALPPKYFYDEEGARLFERITELDAYYPTRTELAILRRSMPEIAGALGPGAQVIEFGSGSGEKTDILLERLESPVAYLPIDISRTQLIDFAERIAGRFPELEVLPVCADYTGELTLPSPRGSVARTLAFFPGSTIGNLPPREAADFLRRVGSLCGPGGCLLIGVDLRKDRRVLERAYNDDEGVTAAFNLNLLRRINRECGADFHPEAFRHQAFYDEAAGRIEMRLVSERGQTVRLGGLGAREVSFEAGDFITTEYSYKYSAEGFGELAARAGWRIERRWTDEREWFGVFLLGQAG